MFRFVLTLVVFLFTYVSSQSLRGYTTLNHCPQFPGAYKSHTRNRWYSYAVARCYVEGGILFTPTCMQELHNVFSQIATDSKEIWISSPFTPLRDQCAKMSSNGSMFYTSCYSGNYVCRNIVTPNIIDEECERKKYMSKGYNHTYGNNLYKYYKIPAILYEPAITCMSDNAEMFAPESQEEARAVFQFIPQNIDKIWVGITKYFTAPNFTTLQGKPFVTTNWADGQPNNQFDYVALNRYLTYETSEYDVSKPFVCRKKIEGEVFNLDIRFKDRV